MNKILIALYLLAILSLGDVVAQNSSYLSFANINPGTGASSISFIMQDHQGLMWIGSNKGLYSYDGYHFQAHYVFDEKSNTRIHCGVEVGKQYLYLGADNGVLIYNLQTDEYVNSPVVFPRDVRTMHLQDNHLWLGSLNGLYALDLNTNLLKHYDINHYPKLAHQAVYTIAPGNDHHLYIGTYNGLSLYSAVDDDFRSIALPLMAKKSNQFINSLLNDSTRGCIWVGMEGGLLRYNPVDESFIVVDELYQQSVKSLALDAKNNLLIGTDNGLYVYSGRNSVQHILHDSRSSVSLSNNIIWNIFADRNHNIWLGTDYGVSLSQSNVNLQYVAISEFTHSGEGNQFYSIFKDSQGYYWFGGTHGLIRSTKSPGGFTQVVWYNMGDQKYPLSHSRIRDIYQDRSDNLWIATDGSINLYNYKTGQFKPFSITDQSGRFNANWAYSIFEDHRGDLWIATCLGGIFVVNRQKLLSSESSAYVADYNFNTENGLSGMFVNQVVPDHQGNVWVLLYNQGINKINGETRLVEKFDFKSTDQVVSPGFLMCDRQGMIWIGFRGGVVRINPQNNQTSTILFDPFSPNEVLSMAEANGRIWVSTSDGLWLVDQASLVARRHNLTDRRFFSLFFDKDANSIYMGDVNGFAIVAPSAFDTAAAEKPIIATALWVNGQPLDMAQQSIRYTGSITLNYRQNNLALDITDLPYHLEEQSRFVYQLLPLDKQWNLLDAKNNRIAYTNLSHGSYQLIVSKLSPEGHPSEQSYILEILIRPPWYYTWWAKSIYVLVFLSLVAWTINFFRVKHRLKIERIEKEKIMEQSRMKMDFLSNLSHELKTPLSMIIAPVSKLIPEVKNAHEKQQLRLVQQNALKMNSVIHKIFDFNRIDINNNVMLIRSHIELVSFARNIFRTFENSDANTQLHFDFDSNAENLYMEADALKMESIIENLVSNAVKYTPSGGTISMKIVADQINHLLHIQIVDTGIGIPEKEVSYVFQRFYQSSLTAGRKEGTGIGLYLVKSYVELHGGTVSVVSAEGRGTTMEIVLPLPVDQPDVAESLLNQPDTASKTDADRPLILIVDDTPEIANFISDMAKPQYKTMVANNGKTGLELCLEYNPDLIISDVMMPVMDGLQMCRQIRKNLPTSTIPIILLTGKNDKSTELESIRMNIDAFVPKPFEPALLLSRIEQLISKNRKIQEKIRMEALSVPKEIEARSYDEKFLSTITQIIEDHLADSELNVSALCDLSGINNKQIYRKVKQLTGKTPVEYIKSVRMKKAAMLLQQQKFTVAEVMYMVGFSNHSYFAKCFKEEFNISPAQYT